MKKVTLTLLIISTFCTISFAQTGAFRNGDNLLNVGMGLNSYYSGGMPVGGSFEFGVTEDISVGVSLDYLAYREAGVSKLNAFYLGARGSYHFNNLLEIKNQKVDLYGGLGSGYLRTSKKGDGNWRVETTTTGAYYEIFMGGKYYFNKSIGGFVELGAAGSTNARIGLAFKF